MPLPRSIQTRLLEAVLIETTACFTDASRVAAGQSAIGLDAYYANRIYARPFDPSETVTPYQINIVPAPPTWEPGTSGRATTLYGVDIAFVFPFEAVGIKSGQNANTHLDHLAALLDWFWSTGTWGSPKNTGAIRDPDNQNNEVAHLAKWQQHEWSPAPGNSGVLVPVLSVWETRDTKPGVTVG